MIDNESKILTELVYLKLKLLREFEKFSDFYQFYSNTNLVHLNFIHTQFEYFHYLLETENFKEAESLLKKIQSANVSFLKFFDIFFLDKKFFDQILNSELDESFAGMSSPPPHSSKEAKKVVDDALRQYSKELRKLQGKVVKDWMSKAKSGVIDFFDLVRGFQHGDSRRAYPYEIDFLMSVLTKDKIIDRFRKYFGGKKALNNRTATSKRK